MLTFIGAPPGRGSGRDGDSGVGLLTSCVSNPTPACSWASMKRGRRRIGGGARLGVAMAVPAPAASPTRARLVGVLVARLAAVAVVGAVALGGRGGADGAARRRAAGGGVRR